MWGTLGLAFEFVGLGGWLSRPQLSAEGGTGQSRFRPLGAEEQGGRGLPRPRP